MVYTDIPLTLDRLAGMFADAKEKNGYWVAKCPAHEDRRASLSIGVSDDGEKLLLKCHAGCDTTSILRMVGLTFEQLNIAPDKRDSRGRKEGNEARTSRVVDRIYNYQEPDGTIRYQVVRYKPKDFVQRHSDGKGGYIWNMKGVEALPYHLPDLIEAIGQGQTIFIVEGEKDVDNLRRIGLSATTHHGGAGNWKPVLNQYFEGADIVLIPDNDLPGVRHVEKVAQMLKPLAARIRVITLPGLPDHGDVSDWLASGGTAEALAQMVETAQDWTPVVPPPPSANTSSDGSESEKVGNMTDLGNAERMYKRYGPDLHYVSEAGRNKWLIWNGRYWESDRLGVAYKYGIETVRAMYRSASEIVDPDRRKALVHWALISEGKTRIDSMVSLTQYMPGISIPINCLDLSPWLLNCANGTIDLRTGDLLPHSRDDLLTKNVDVNYIPDAQAPTWNAFLQRIMDNNQSLIGFLQRAIGYSLTGDTTEQCLFFLHGTGANGKSTFIETIRSLIGDYAQQTPTESLMYKNDAAGANNDIARLRGARLVAATETDEGQRLAETLIKQLSGGDTITARYLFGEFFEYVPTFKIWLVGNHKPEIRGTDFAIWRRIRLVPFGITIPEEDRDPHLRQKLITELPGILTWAVQGCLDWQMFGLGTPPEVRMATENYRATMDTFSNWLDQNTLRIQSANTRSGVLYANFQQYCKDGGEMPISQKKFSLRLEDLGFVKSRSSRGISWSGIGLIQEDNSDDKRESKQLNDGVF